MKPMEAYTTIQGQSSAEVIEKKSRFIAHIVHVETEEEALAFLEEIRAAHRMARHNVYAYCLRNQGRVRYSDDGEPQKTAGLPTLTTIQHAGLIDVMVVVTRYFGGVLLGTGGLVRAYTQATQAAIVAARVVCVSRCVLFEVEIPYTHYEQVLRLAEQEGASQREADFSDKVLVRLVFPENKQDNLLEKLEELLRGQGSIAISDPFDAVL